MKFDPLDFLRSNAWPWIQRTPGRPMDNHELKLKVKVKVKVKLKGDSRALYLNVVESIDLRLRGAGDLSQACGGDLH